MRHDVRTARSGCEGVALGILQSLEGTPMHSTVTVQWRVQFLGMEDIARVAGFCTAPCSVWMDGQHDVVIRGGQARALLRGQGCMAHSRQHGESDEPNELSANSVAVALTLEALWKRDHRTVCDCSLLDKTADGREVLLDHIRRSHLGNRDSAHAGPGRCRCSR